MRFQVFEDLVGGDAGEVEALAARQDGDGDFLDFGGGEDEFDVGGGSSSVLSSALKAALESMWTSSMM